MALLSKAVQCFVLLVVGVAGSVPEVSLRAREKAPAGLAMATEESLAALTAKFPDARRWKNVKFVEIFASAGSGCT